RAHVALFFFQAEDGIRYFHVTGVQTCALPIYPGVALPDRDVLPVYRTDGSGTTFIFTSFLGSTSGRWNAGPGVGKAVRWPRGVRSEERRVGKESGPRVWTNQ